MQIVDENEINLENTLSSLDCKYEEIFKPKILVFGIGGGGVNAVNSMADSDLINVDFVVANTDYQSLENSKIKKKILLGKKTTCGTGAGADPLVGKAAAEESIKEIEEVFQNISMIFITAGMGGGTGTGAAPVIAKKAREMGILVAAIVTKPFLNEGSLKMQLADEGIAELKKNVDTLIIVPNQNLFRLANQDTKMQDSLKMVDNVLKSGVKGIVDLITKSGFINLDFSDVRTVMKKIGKAMMGTGEASGPNRAIKAVEEAISNPLLDNISIKGAKGVIINITGSTDMTLLEFEDATKRIKDEIDNEFASIILGNVFDDSLQDTIRVSIFATGIDDDVDEQKNEEMVSGESNISNENFDEKEQEYVLYEDNEIDSVNDDNNDYNSPKSLIRKNNFIRKKIGVDENYNNEEDFFDIGESIDYDEFNKINKKKDYYTKNSESVQNDIENKNIIKNKKEYHQNKKSGFFSFFSGVSKHEDFTIKNIENDKDFELNIDLYQTPAYSRNKKNN